MCCSVCVAVETALLCSSQALSRQDAERSGLCVSVLHCVAVCCSVLHCAAVYCSVLQCVAVCYSVLQCVAVEFAILAEARLFLAIICQQLDLWTPQLTAT